jgi:hypothetical protein
MDHIQESIYACIAPASPTSNNELEGESIQSSCFWDEPSGRAAADSHHGIDDRSRE